LFNARLTIRQRIWLPFAGGSLDSEIPSTFFQAGIELFLQPLQERTPDMVRWCIPRVSGALLVKAPKLAVGHARRPYAAILGRPAFEASGSNHARCAIVVQQVNKPGP
jgi:hypothetical protein